MRRKVEVSGSGEVLQPYAIGALKPVRGTIGPNAGRHQEIKDETGSVTAAR